MPRRSGGGGRSSSRSFGRSSTSVPMKVAPRTSAPTRHQSAPAHAAPAHTAPTHAAPAHAAPSHAAPHQPASHAAPHQPTPHQPSSQQPVYVQAQQPSLMGQMAATAGGVALGSAVGHTLGAAMTGMFGNDSSQPAVPAAEAATQPEVNTSPPLNGVCAWETKQFLDCAQRQSDLSLCQGFSEALRQCKVANNISY